MISARMSAAHPGMEHIWQRFPPRPGRRSSASRNAYLPHASNAIWLADSCPAIIPRLQGHGTRHCAATESGLESNE